MSYVDKTLTCRDCGVTFVFTASEQEFYASRGFANEPGRCPACRAARKAQQGPRGDREGEARSRGVRVSASREPRQMYPAVCTACGVATEVPFAPRDDRPVYCSNCFEQRRR